METAYTVSLKIDGIIEQSKSGNIAGNMAEPLEFQVIKSEPGTYYVEINGRKSFFTVVDNGEVARTSQTGIAGPIIFSALSIVFGTILAVFLRKCRISI
jgi:hypothetical protein